MKKIFICLFMLLSLLTFTSCSNTNVTSDDQAKTPLATPTLTLSGNVASWTQISGAVNYELSLDGETSNTNITTYTFNQTEPGTYKLKVRALASNDSNFTNSDYSNEVAYTVEAKAPIKEKLTAPIISLNDDVVSWEPINNASGYQIKINDDEKQLKSTSYQITESTVGTYKIQVMALAAADSNYLNSDYSNEVEYVVESVLELANTTIYLVGDSTVASFNDVTYYYPRYGYGTMLSQYLSPKAEVVNLALSGRSSKSYLVESNYQNLKSSLKENDYLLIGFGHNDEKNDDPTRFSSANGSLTEEGSFKYNLYNYYIKLAEEKSATPILVTPIVRANSKDDYTGSSAHITAYGDYRQAICELGEEVGVTVLDLTTATKNLYEEVRYDEAIKFHAWTTSNSASVDTTHLNIYGAKMVAYNLVTLLQNSNCQLKNYVKDDISAPTVADLVVNPNYQESDYKPFDATTYVPKTWTNFISPDWYGTAFGDCGGTPTSKSSGYVAEELVANEFTVGQTGTSSPKGKIASSTEGIAMIFKQVSINKNFKITAEVKVSSEVDTKQAGFGLMLRDDIYVEQSSSDKSIISNYVAAGMYTSDSATNIIYSRESTKLINSGNVVNGLYQTGDTALLEIERIGQVVNVKVTYKDVVYEETYTDFDFVAIDREYMYVGMYATRGTVAQFTNVSFAITGDAMIA